MTTGRTAHDLAPLGPKVRERLSEIGVTETEELARRGSVAVYNDLLSRAHGRPTPRCYYLFGLEAAIVGKRWNELSLARREELALSAAGDGGTKYRQQPAPRLESMLRISCAPREPVR